MIIAFLTLVKYGNSSEEDGILDHYSQRQKEKWQEKTIIFRINISKDLRESLQSCRNEPIMYYQVCLLKIKGSYCKQEIWFILSLFKVHYSITYIILQ